MPDNPISGLPAAGALASADLTVLVQGGVTVQSTVGAFSVFTLAAGAVTFNWKKSNAAAADPVAANDSTQGYVPGSFWFNTVTGRQSVNFSNAAAAASWYSLGAAYHGVYVSTRFYCDWPATFAAGGAEVANTLRLVPFVAAAGRVEHGMGARLITVSAGGSFAMGVYASNPATGLPTGPPLSNTNAISTAVGGSLSGNYLADVTIEPGKVYWRAHNIDNSTATFVIYLSSVPLYGFLIGDPAQGNVVGGGGGTTTSLTIAQAFGAWPDLTGTTDASYTKDTGTRGVAMSFLVT